MSGESLYDANWKLIEQLIGKDPASVVAEYTNKHPKPYLFDILRGNYKVYSLKRRFIPRNVISEIRFLFDWWFWWRHLKWQPSSVIANQSYLSKFVLYRTPNGYFKIFDNFSPFYNR
jgi:hypothetical protein